MNTPTLFVLLLTAASTALGQVKEVWTVRYNAGLPDRDHRAVAMALDKAGNIYVAGSSQNSTNGFDYVVLKYAPEGVPIWTARYACTNGSKDQIKGFAVASDGSSALTGSNGTVKFSPKGTLAFGVPYAGNGIAMDTNGNVYVTGFSAVDLATVKLDNSGSNVWLRTYDKIGKIDISQLVTLDAQQNVYVAGWATWSSYLGYNYAEPILLRYDSAGTLVWVCEYWRTTEAPGAIQTKGLALDSSGAAYITGNGRALHGYFTYKVNADGHGEWDWAYGSPEVAGLCLGPDSVFLTGYLTVKLDASNGGLQWKTLDFNYALNAAAPAPDGGVYASGTVLSSATSNDWATVKYDANGNLAWVKRYNGPANGDDGAVALAVGPDGSLYVAGYSANSSGGTDITTIKYAPPQPIRRSPTGSMLLQAPGASGQTNRLQASTNLESWLDLGLVPADADGIFQFEDTNALVMPYRFYRWSVP